MQKVKKERWCVKNYDTPPFSLIFSLSKLRIDGNEKLLSVLHFVNDSLECFRMIHTEVSENLAVDVDTVSVKKTHHF